MALPSRNDVSAVNQVLTNMAIAYEQSESRFAALRAFPPVNADNRSGTYYTFDKGYFMLDDMNERAAGAPFGTLDYGVSTSTFTTKQWAADHAIADETRAANQAPLSLEQAALRRLTVAGLIKKERQFATDFMTTSVWANDNTTATDWDDFSAGDPVNDIITAQRTVSQSTGYMPNTMVMGQIVYDALRNHPDIIDRLKAVQVADQANIAAALGAIFGMGEILVSYAVYNSANETATATPVAIIDDDCLVLYREPGDMMTATAGKTFVWQPGGGGGSVYNYRDNARHADVLQYKMQWDMVATATDCGFFYSDIV